MNNAIALLKIQLTRLNCLIAETTDPDMSHELRMLVNENAGALKHLYRERDKAFRTQGRIIEPSEFERRLQQAIGERK